MAIRRAQIKQRRASKSSDVLVEQTIEQFGHVDVLVNNAGIERLRSFYKEPEEYINQVIDVNLLGGR